MQITPETKINDQLATHEFLLDFLVTLSPKYKLLINPIVRNTVGKMASTAAASKCRRM